MNRKTGVLLAVFIALMAAAPLVADNYTLSVLTTLVWFAYLGQSWNVMMGFAGLLSLGHALYVGLGAYVAAGLYVHFGIGPWAGMWLAMAAAGAAGGFIGFLGFRFGVRGVHFALLTIAFAEVARIAFDHIGALGGSGGFFLPVGGHSLPDLRLTPKEYYYTILALMLVALVVARWLLHSRLGYRWLAVRENPDAAAAVGIDLFSTRIAAVVVSSMMTALGGVFQAFYFNSLFPEQAFSMGRSLEIILPVIIGGIGTLFGPILGALILTPLGEALTWAIGAVGLDLPGLKQFFYGVVLVAIIVYLPDGVWPWLAARLRLGARGEDGR